MEKGYPCCEPGTGVTPSVVVSPDAGMLKARPTICRMSKRGLGSATPLDLGGLAFPPAPGDPCLPSSSWSSPSPSRASAAFTSCCSSAVWALSLSAEAFARILAFSFSSACGF